MTASNPSRSRTRASLAILLSAVLVALAAPFAASAVAATAAARGPDGAATASGFLFYKLPQGQPLCSGLGLNVSANPYYSRDDCGFVNFNVSESPTAVEGQLYAVGADQPFKTLPATDRGSGVWRVTLVPDGTWEAGEIRLVIVADGQSAGETQFGHNLLGATFNSPPDTFRPGQDIPVSGEVYKIDTDATGAMTHAPAGGATFVLNLVMPDGSKMKIEDVTTQGDGTFSATIPGSATADLTAGPETNYQVTLAVEAANAAYQDPTTGAWAANRAGAGAVTVVVPPTDLVLENSFVSAVGWVKPGATYPSRIFVRNLTDRAFSNVQVTVTTPVGTSFTQAAPSADGGTATVTADTITWNVGAVPAAPDGGQTVRTLVIESRADTLTATPTLVWRDLATTATLTSAEGSNQTDQSHGPKVIPPSEIYDTARYGDRPFPVVPVDYLDRKHLPSNSGDELSGKINSPDIEGSTFNLWQESSVGQLFPHGTVPSSGIATRGFEYAPGFDFTNAQPQGTCHGATVEDSPADVKGTPLYPERIKDGFYQLPGNTDYYGDDRYGSALPGAIAGVGPLFQIDDACGPTGKLVYDSAVIADPEIDYSDYDTDKDGVVDFFMVVYAGCGGHGASQTGCDGEYSDAPYDNVWPHSSSLEFYYTDPDTGQSGYVSDDQLKNLKGEKLYYTDQSRGQMTTNPTDFPVYVRVGPYNVNPENSIDKASVISHEYGHSLGLPDFYSLGNRDTYGDWNLMATDKSQNLDIFSRQELGWVVPEVLEPGAAQTVEGWTDSKQDTNTIKWQTPDGTPYTLQGPNVHNSQAYVAKLPGRQLMDPAKFDTGDTATKSHAWWSGSGNDFGCPPEGGHNLDVVIPGASDLPAGSELKLEFKSLWDIEWDYDYGFVLTSNNGGQEYVSHESQKGYTTPATNNPNGNQCQLKYGNGITGSSGSYQGNNSPQTDRLLGNYPESVFLADSYDISDLAGVEDGVLRFSYSTDPGLARPGWFIDDIKVTATLPDNSQQVLLETDLEDESEGGPDSPYFFNGGCKDDTAVATQCTPGWNYINASAGSDADHAYYMEMRDRSGFDLDGNGESDRGLVDWAAGLSLVYTDEAHGYGNVGTSNPPAQSPLDSQPQPGNNSPILADAAWTAAVGDNRFSDSGTGHTDNYDDPSQTEADPRYPEVEHPWRFRYDCLTFDVLGMAGAGDGPQEANGDLTGDVRFTMGTGCGQFDYGYIPDGGGTDPPGNTPPTADATVSPKAALKKTEFTFDASRSTDAETPDDLDYVWNFGDGGVPKDAVGEVVRHKFATAGVYRAVVTVTDPRGATDTDSVKVLVTRRVQCGHPAVDRQGGWRTEHNAQAQREHFCINDEDRRVAGDSMTMRFTGPRIDVNFGKAADGGSAAVFIDGQQVGTVWFFKRSQQPEFGFVRGFRGLGPGEHEIRLVVNPRDGDRRYAYIDSFTIAGQPRA